MIAAGRPEPVARMLGLAARIHADPILLLAAAEAELAHPNPDDGQLARAIQLTQETRQLVDTPGSLRIAPEEGPQLSTEAKVLADYATTHRSILRQERRGKAQLGCGVSFLLLGVAGMSVAISGAVLGPRVEAARGAYSGQDMTYLGDLDRARERANTMLAIGPLSGLVGAAIGIPLTVAGSRDLRRSRTGRAERPSFRFQPGLTSFFVAGKF